MLVTFSAKTWWAFASISQRVLVYFLFLCLSRGVCPLSFSVCYRFVFENWVHWISFYAYSSSYLSFHILESDKFSFVFRFSRLLTKFSIHYNLSINSSFNSDLIRFSKFLSANFFLFIISQIFQKEFHKRSNSPFFSASFSIFEFWFYVNSWCLMLLNVLD